MRRDGSVSDAVITTWQISFEQIRKTRPAAAELLLLMAMFDRQGIPESILYAGRDRIQFEDAVAPLTSSSLIKAQNMKQPEQQVREHLFEMHDLVQLATTKWLEVQKQVGRWQKTSLQIIATAFPSGQHETWAACRVLLPHARKALGYVLEETEAKLDRARITDNTVFYFLLAGEYAAAEQIGRTAVAGREEVLGVEHPDTLTIVSHLGWVLERQGKYEEAEAMHWQALEGYRKVLGVEHPNTLTRMANLASTLWSQRKWKEAEDMEIRVMETSQKVLGHEHPNTLMAIGNLAFTLKSQSRDKEAISLMETCFQLQERVLGRHHPNTKSSLETLNEWQMENIEIRV
ncbi:uncharacterized protein BP5553_07126 [Venustampulla echinocandica]|uniref:TPR-like protein n=1 Tax=Venustampulla echinocandica TaxID=2656787 RepID=A0A370TIM1_9HELO|nr:uncharacterized protein BP5553_07126 [Venustampulla echinocandica]RDL35195.1 hypothetical protein BP5553_07126 [Venustampulla echinocandica]